MKKVITLTVAFLCLALFPLVGLPTIEDGGTLTCTGDKSKICAKVKRTFPDGGTLEWEIYGDTAVYVLE